MGVDLFGKGQSLGLNWHGWRESFEVALEFGWRPAGTEVPEDFEGLWEGSYFSNDGQRVTEADACALAAALLRARDAMEHQDVSDAQADVLHNDSPNAIIALADLARRGAFLIL